jgi:signal transduction histidine kinase
MKTTDREKHPRLQERRADSQNRAAIAPRLAPIARGRGPDLRGLKRKAQVGERPASLGGMAAVFVHEVANPLSGIAVNLEFVKKSLERGEYDSYPLIATLQDTMLEIDRLNSLLKEFRAIGCPQNMDFQKTDLVKITREVLSCQYAAYRKLGITVEVQFENSLPVIMAHADKIKQVVLNLCKNAVEAMPDGGHLSVKGYRFARAVALEISDTGAVIPEGLDVFELFRTTTRNGSGLGLPLVRQIVSAHRGTIHYTSVPGPSRRTTFRISLPAAD